MKISPLRILLVRHAETVPWSERTDRPLSARGIRDAAELAAKLATEKVIAVYSSPYRRAHQTIEPLAGRLSLPIAVVDDLRERLLHAAVEDDWQRQTRRAWEDFDFTYNGGESSRQAQQRILQVLEDILARHEDGTVAVASHGNLIALAIQAVENDVGHDFWKAMPLPAMYCLAHDGRRWRVAGPGL